MFYKSIFLLLLLGAITSYSFSEKIGQDDIVIPSVNSRKKENSGEFVVVNPKQIQYLETTLRNFVSRLAEPIKQPIVLRSTLSRKNNLQRSIRQICESIRKTLIQFAKDCGLKSSVQRYERSFTNVALTEDWFAESLLQGSHMLCDVGSMAEEIWTSADRYFTKRNVTTPRGKQRLKVTNGFVFLGAINEVAQHSEQLSQCLLQMANKKQNETSFNFNRVLLNLTRDPPRAALSSLRSTFDNTSFDISSKDYATARKLHAFLCLSIINKDVYYDACIRELQQLDECIHASKQRSDNKTDNHEIKPWLRAIQDLSDCKIHPRKNGQVYVSCEMKRKMPRKMRQKVKYIYERILGRQVSRRSPLYRVANELGNIISRSSWGKRFVNELYQYFAIYEEGRKRLDRLSAVAASSKKTLARYRKVSKSLELYKKGILLRTFGAINKMHHTALGFEKFLVQGIKVTLNETWQSHIKILSCMTEWMVKLLELYGGENINKKSEELLLPSTPSSEVAKLDEDTDWRSDESFSHYEGNGLEPLTSRTRNDIMKEADVSMANLMKSMNRVSRFRSTNEKSMLTCLANNLLLVAIFMETIGFVSTLFCLGQGGGSELSSSEVDHWGRGRQRRSLLSLDYQDDTESISKEFELTVVKNFTIQFDGNKYWRLYDEFIKHSNYSGLGYIEITGNSTGNNVTMNK